MNTSIIKFDYNGNIIPFEKGNDVMVNLTSMAKAYPDKNLSTIVNSQEISDYCTSLSKLKNFSLADLLIVKRGGDNPGTWAHRLVAIRVAQKLNSDLAVWVDMRVDELLKYGMTATQPTLEQMINNPDLVISLATQLKNEREEKARLEQEKKQLEEKNAKLKPKADFAEAAFKAEGKVDIGQAAKILNLGFGRNTLFKKLKEVGVFFKDRNEPKQKYIDAGYFEMTLLPPIHRDSHPDILYQKVLCKPKGLAYINQLFGGKPSDRKISPIK